jgi:hypothetical protein
MSWRRAYKKMALVAFHFDRHLLEFVHHGQHTDATTLEPNYSLLCFSNGLLPLTKVWEYREGNNFASRLVIKFGPKEAQTEAPTRPLRGPRAARWNAAMVGHVDNLAESVAAMRKLMPISPPHAPVTYGQSGEAPKHFPTPSRSLPLALCACAARGRTSAMDVTPLVLW